MERKTRVVSKGIEEITEVTPTEPVPVLPPIAEPVAVKPKRGMSEKQLAALALGREKRRKAKEEKLALPPVPPAVVTPTPPPPPPTQTPPVEELREAKPKTVRKPRVKVVKPVPTKPPVSQSYEAPPDLPRKLCYVSY